MLETLIFLAGVGQLVLIIGSLAIPKVLGWAEDTSKLKTLTRQVFWTYAGYIWATNFAFGLISVLSPASLIEGSFLSTSVSIFIFVYWLARIVIQFTYFDRREAPSGGIFVVAEVVLVALFICLTAVYGWAVIHNIMGVN